MNILCDIHENVTCGNMINIRLPFGSIFGYHFIWLNVIYGYTVGHSIPFRHLLNVAVLWFSVRLIIVGDMKECYSCTLRHHYEDIQIL